MSYQLTTTLSAPAQPPPLARSLITSQRALSAFQIANRVLVRFAQLYGGHAEVVDADKNVLYLAVDLR